MKAVMEMLKASARKLGIELTAEQVDRFEAYYRELIDWNKKINLTSVTDYEEVQLIHFLDSLTVVKAVPGVEELKIIDVGTGAGLPGIPLKIAFPDISLTLLESTGKKVTFLEAVVVKLGLKGVEIMNARAEEAAHNVRYREKFDVVLSRAVASLPVLAELALPFCAVGGCFVALKKGEIEPEIASASRAIALMGGALRAVMLVMLAELDDARVLVVIDKTAPTPDKYPRRSGMPAKKPIIS